MTFIIICLASPLTVGMSSVKSTFGLPGVPVMFMMQSTRTLLFEKDCPTLMSESGTLLRV